MTDHNTSHNKLVRDGIPEKIEANGETSSIRILNEEEYRTELKKKLLEEITEFLRDPCAEEAGDIREVLEALIISHGISDQEVQNSQTEKRDRLGGFNKRIFLISTSKK